MARLRLLKSALLTVFILWVVGCFAFFLSGFLTLQFGAPRWLPLPWSDFTNFVESPDGHVFVNLCFYSRVLSYDRKGRFKASYHYPPGGTKDTELAVSADNRVFFRSQNHVAVLTTGWDLQETVHKDFREERSWELSEGGHPAHAPHRAREWGPARSVKPGELLFSKRSRGLALGPRQDAFHNADGSSLWRVGNSLERVSADGKVEARYGSLWIYKPFEFPIPGVFAWVACFAIAGVLAFRMRLQERKAKKVRGGR